MKTFLLIALAIFITLGSSFESNAQTRKTGRIATGTLSLEVGLVSNSGEAKPVVRTPFYLLDKDLEEILIAANLEADIGIDTSKPAQSTGTGAGMLGARLARKRLSLLESFANWSGRRDPSKLAQVLEAIKPHIVATMTTDFSGKGVFPAVQEGKYFLVGGASANRQGIVWNLATVLKRGTQSIILDNSNAAVIR